MRSLQGWARMHEQVGVGAKGNVALRSVRPMIREIEGSGREMRSVCHAMALALVPKLA